MAKRLAIPSENAELEIVGPLDSFLVSRVQRVDINRDVPTTDVYELGNNQSAGNVQDTPNITITFSVYDVGIKTFSVLTGTDPTAYPASGVDISNLGEADAIIFIKDADVSDYVKSAHAKRLQIRDFTFTYNVDGEATEDYTLIGSAYRWFTNDVVVDRFTTGTTSFTLSETPVTLKNGDALLSVILDGEYMTEVASGPATGEYSVSGTTLTTGDTRTAQVIAVYQAAPTGTNWAYVSDSDVPAAIRGKDIAVTIVSESIPRVQSVTINGNLNVQNVKEMGNRAIVGYQRQVPTVDGTLAVLDTDTELIDLITNGSISSGDTEFEIGIGCVTSGVPLLIELRDPCDTSSPYTVLKSVYIPNMTPVGDAWSSVVNQNGTWNVNWKSYTNECIVYSGARP